MGGSIRSQAERAIASVGEAACPDVEGDAILIATWSGSSCLRGRNPCRLVLSRRCVRSTPIT